MTNYKVIIQDRNYTEWNYCNANTFDKIELNINPLEKKLAVSLRLQFFNLSCPFGFNPLRISHGLDRPWIRSVIGR
jgi:hypothetical protein